MADTGRYPPANQPMLLGRRGEREASERLLTLARAGRGGVLVVGGEAGIGKTALLKHVHDTASGFRVEDAVGVESEVEFASISWFAQDGG